MNKAIITGVAGTAMGKIPGSTSMSLMTEAALAAIADAGLETEDIDGILCAYSVVEPQIMLASTFSDYAGFKSDFALAVQVGGASGATMVMNAAALVESGRCRHVLICAGDNRVTGMSRDDAVAFLAGSGSQQFEQIYGMSLPSAYALVARRYMHEYGLTSEHLAAIAVTQRKHACAHPLAQFRAPITIEDVLSSRMIASPLHLLDCCGFSDGAGAVIVSAADAARDTAKAPIAVLGSGQGNTHEFIVSAPSLTEFGCKSSGATAFGRAGVRPSDIDVAEIYDSYTITIAVELESLGFFERGEAGPAALAGALGIDGKLPCNTHGGLLSHGHPGAAGGVFHVVEAVQQLRGTALGLQVPDAKLAFVHGDGGVLSAHCSLVLGKI